MKIGTYYYPEQWPRDQWERDFDNMASLDLRQNADVHEAVVAHHATAAHALGQHLDHPSQHRHPRHEHVVGVVEQQRDDLPGVGQRLLGTTDRAFRLVVSDNPVAGVMRTKIVARIAARAMQQPAIQRFAFRVVSQIGIDYRDGPLSLMLENPPHDAPRAGDRFPWLELAFTPGGPPEDLANVRTVFLVDTYDTAQGIRNAVEVAGPELGAVRLDSGDLADETRRARALLGTDVAYLRDNYITVTAGGTVTSIGFRLARAVYTAAV